MRDNGHYLYFTSLERTIKISLAVYLLILIIGAVLLVYGVGRSWEVIRGLQNWGFYSILAILAGFGGMYILVSKINWLGDLHIWLDRRFFGFLERSNDIIFQAVVRALESDDQSQARDLSPDRRYSMIQSIFSRLAGNFRLFDSLIESGIFRYWIWYWVMNYGTFIFSILTIATFFGLLSGADPGLRTAFIVCWGASLVHLMVNLLLGHHLTRMTRRVSETIVSDYKPQIVTMMHESIAR